jgi:hypothetical protein
MRDKRLEQDLKRAVEFAIVMGSGYVKMEWNATTGEVYDFIEPEYKELVDEDGNEIYDADGNIVYETDEDGEKVELVKANYDSMAKYGVQGTPTVFIDGKLWERKSSDFNPEEFRAAVEGN